MAVANLNYDRDTGLYRINNLSIDKFLSKLETARAELGVSNPVISAKLRDFARFYAEHINCTEPIQVIAKHFYFENCSQSCIKGESCKKKYTEKTSKSKINKKEITNKDKLFLCYYFFPDYTDSSSRVPSNCKITESELEFQTETDIEWIPVPKEISFDYNTGTPTIDSFLHKDVLESYMEKVKQEVKKKLAIFPKKTRFNIHYDYFPFNPSKTIDEFIL